MIKHHDQPDANQRLFQERGKTIREKGKLIFLAKQVTLRCEQMI